jgi:hypothetical protein
MCTGCRRRHGVTAPARASRGGTSSPPAFWPMRPARRGRQGTAFRPRVALNGLPWFSGSACASGPSGCTRRNRTPASPERFASAAAPSGGPAGRHLEAGAPAHLLWLGAASPPRRGGHPSKPGTGFRRGCRGSTQTGVAPSGNSSRSDLAPAAISRRRISIARSRGLRTPGATIPPGTLFLSAWKCQ